VSDRGPDRKNCATGEIIKQLVPRQFRISKNDSSTETKHIALAGKQDRHVLSRWGLGYLALQSKIDKRSI